MRLVASLDLELTQEQIWGGSGHRHVAGTQRRSIR